MRTAVAMVLAGAVAAAAARPGTDPLAADLRSPAPAVRARAAERAGARGEKRFLPDLARLLRDGDAAVRAAAAEALGRLGRAEAVGPLTGALGDADPTVRFRAAHALGRLACPAAAAALLSALNDRQWAVRAEAAGALCRLPDPALTGRLVEALRAPGADAELVGWVLKQRKADASAVAALLGEADPAVRRRAVAVLAAVGGQRAGEALVGALSDADAAVRAAAVAALAERRQRQAAEALSALARRERDPAVRKAAAEAARALSAEDDLLGWWSFDAAGAAAGRDVTGRGNDGEVRGCTTVAGKVGRALRFEKGGFVELGRPAALPVANRPFTVAAWVRPEAADGVVVARGGAYCGFSLYVMEGRPKFGIHRQQDGPSYIAAGRERLAGGEWVHLAGVVRADRIELYVGGRPAASAKIAGPLPGNCGQGMEIGFDVGNSAAEITTAFRGCIDEVRMYGRALSGGEIARLAEAESKPQASRKK